MPKQLSHSSSLFSFFSKASWCRNSHSLLISRVTSQLASNLAKLHEDASLSVHRGYFDVIVAVLAVRCSSCVVPVVKISDVGDSPDVNELSAEARYLRPVIGSGAVLDPLFAGNASLPLSRPASRSSGREGRRPAATALCPLPAARCNLPVRPRRCCSLIIPRSQQTFALHPFACSFQHLFIS